MTVTAEIFSELYAGNGVTTIFAYRFKLFDKSEMRNRLIDAASGAATLQTEPAQYTTTGVGLDGGGTVVFVTPPAIGQNIDLRPEYLVTQPTSIKNQNDFQQVVHETAFDRRALTDQMLLRLLRRCLHVADFGEDSAILVLPSRAARIGKFQAYDANGEPIASAGTGNDAALRTDLASTTVANEGAALVGFRQSGAGAGARTGLAKLREFVSAADFGAVGDNVADDYAAIQAAIDYVSGAGGGVVYLTPGVTHRSNSAPIIKDDVVLSLQGGKLRMVLTGTNGADYGLRLRNRSWVVGGEVAVESSGVVGSQAGIHAGINVGPLYGDGGTVVSPSADEGVTGWGVLNVRVSTNRNDKSAIQIYGGANNGVIDQVEIPDSAAHFIGIGLDWAFLGTIDSADLATSRTNFDAGNAFTTHPNNIRITNIKIGNQTRAGCHGVRLSGVHNVTVRNVDLVGSVSAGFFHTAGDLGYEFAPAAVKPRAHKGVRVSNFVVQQANKGWGFFVDCFADNVQAGTGSYTEFLDPYCETDITLEQCRTRGDNTNTAVPGFRIQNTRGCNLIDCEATEHFYGVVLEENADRVNIVRGRFWKNRQKGIWGGHANTPEDCVIDGAKCDQNGQDAADTSSAGIFLNGMVRPTIRNCVLGADGYVAESTQIFGIRLVDGSVTGAKILNNHVAAVDGSPAGVAYSFGASTDYAMLDLYQGNSAAAAIGTKYGGINIVPIEHTLAPDGTVRRTFMAAEASLTGDTTPTAGAWVQGDRIYYSDPDASDFIGTCCTASGSPGTWKRFGATAA